MKKIFLFLSIVYSLYSAEVIFKRGDVSVGMILGSGSIEYGNNSQTYFIGGLEANYFIIDGLSIGVGANHWFGDNPTLTEYYFPVTYYLDISSDLYPYAGITYKYNSYSETFDNYSSLVYRGGVAYKVEWGYIAFGYAFDNSLDNEVDDRSYPELTFGFVF